MRGPAFSPNGAFDKQSRWGKVVGGKGREEKGGKRDHENKLTREKTCDGGDIPTKPKNHKNGRGKRRKGSGR